MYVVSPVCCLLYVVSPVCCVSCMLCLLYVFSCESIVLFRALVAANHCCSLVTCQTRRNNVCVLIPGILSQTMNGLKEIEILFTFWEWAIGYEIVCTLTISTLAPSLVFGFIPTIFSLFFKPVWLWYLNRGIGCSYNR